LGGLPSDLAVAEDVPTLAVIGLQALYPAVVGSGLLVWTVVVERRLWPSKDPEQALSSSPSDQRVGRRYRRGRLAVFIVVFPLVTVALVGGVALLLWNGSLIVAVGVLVGMAGTLIGQALARRRLSTLAIGAVALAIASPLAALSGVIPSPATAISIQTDASSVPVWYDPVGVRDGFIYARSCDPAHKLEAIPIRLITNITYAARPGDTPRQISVAEFFSGVPLQLGYVTGCTAI
jgi:hypothetical protein